MKYYRNDYNKMNNHILTINLDDEIVYLIYNNCK
jgi:hypothetical protein